jgi:hypothetical protein
MRKLTFRFIVALLTFILGIAVTTVWFIHRSHKPEELRVIIPKERWVTIFFETTGLASKSINEITNEAHLQNLRTSLLPDNDIEVRIWSGFGEDGKVYGVILKRSSNQWSVIHLEADRRQPTKKSEDVHAVPKSGWETAWGRLTSAGILTLPDASEVQCNTHGLDGIGYIVEVNMNQTYKTYMYDNPQFARCNAAKQIIKIAEIIDEEFGWTDSRVRE